MNCDLVFDHLTRGPIPTGDPATDDAVERHLAACHDCRCLAEALRPAVDLFHEALGESADLPCYDGALPVLAAGAEPSSVSVLEAVLPAADAADVQVPPGRRRNRAGRVAIVVGGVLAIAAVAVFVGRGEPSTRVRESVMASGGLTALELVDEPRAQRLTALGPIEPCRPKLTIHGARGQLVQCCSVCHVAAGDVPTAEPATRAVAKSCMVCHRKAAETESLRSLENEVFDSEGLRG